MPHAVSLSSRVGLILVGLMMFGASRTMAATPQPTLDLMTINMEHHDNPRELEAMATDLKTHLKKLPDFILCQEVVFQRHTTKENPEDYTAAILARHLGYYSEGTKRTSDHEGIAIISKYPFDHYESINLKSQTLRVLLGFRRVSVMGEFTVPGIGKVRITNTHLTNWPFEGHVRDKQISETMEWVEQRQQTNPAVLNFFGGDFNAKIDWSEMGQVTEPSIDPSLDYVNHNGTAYSQGDHGHPSKRIDYIFMAAQPKFSGGLTFLGEQMLWQAGLTYGHHHFYPSDHLGVVHTYAVDPKVFANTTVAGTADIR